MRVDAGYWDGWFCHGYCNATDDRRRLASSQERHPTKRDWHAWPLGPARRYADGDVDRCRKPKSEAFYVCDCGRVAALRFAALVSSVVVGRDRPVGVDTGSDAP